MKRTCFFALVFLIFSSRVFAQLDFTVTAPIVSESISNNTQDVIFVTSAQIEDAHCSRLTEVLEKTANVTIKQYGAYGMASSPSIRGFGGSAVAILVDGVQVNSAQTGDFDLNRININDIERIEIVRGGSDSKYSVSGGVGGIINVVTKKSVQSDALKFLFDASNLSYWATSFFDTQNIFASLSKRHNFNAANLTALEWKISSSFVNAKNEFQYEDFSGEKVARKNNNAKSNTTNFAGTFYLPKKMQLKISDNFFAQSLLNSGTITSATVGKQKNLFNSANVIFDAPSVFGGIAETQIQLAYKLDSIFYDEDFFNDNDADESRHKLHSIFFANRYTFFCAENFNLNVAADFSADFLSSTDCADFVKNFSGGILATPEILFSAIEIYPSCKFLFSKQGVVPVPKIGISFLQKKFKFSANAYRMFTYPTLNQLYWKNSAYACGNPNLQNEDGWGGDFIFSFAHKFANGASLSIDASVFATYYKNKIQWAQIATKWIPQNAGEAAYFGGSVATKVSPTKHFSFGAKYDCNLSFLLSDGRKISDNIRIMYTPIHAASFDASYKTEKFSATIFYNFVGKRYISNINSIYLAPYNLVDISVEYKLKNLFAFYCVVKNLFDADYTETDGYPMPNRSVKIGVRIKN